MNDPVFEQVYIFGDNSPFIGCAVVLSKKYWAELASSLNLNPDDVGNLKSAQAVEVVVNRIRALTQSFPYYAQPKAVILSLEPWTIENSLITPTLKLKRNNLADHFTIDIQDMYHRAPTSSK